MKIICVDSFNRDYIPDTLIAENVHVHYGKIIVGLLNERRRVHSQEYYKLVEDNYKLLTIDDIN